MSDPRHPQRPEELVAEERFRMLVESVQDYALFMLDRTGHVVTWNPGAERLNGYRAHEIIGRHFSVFYPDETTREQRCRDELVVAASEGRFEEEGWRVRADGTQFWASVVINAIRDARGGVVGFAKITRDLTERKRAEEERTARVAAETANRAKDQFLAMLGHELRNPLAPIVTAVEILKQRGSDAREVEVIERQLHHVTRLVDDLLDVARIVQGKIEVRRELLDLTDVVTRSVEQARSLLEQRRHVLTVDVPDRALFVEGDHARLVQVFGNLVVNAAKYTAPGGHISVSVRDTNGRVAVEVRDDGVGIAPDLLPRVFDLFAQGAQGGETSPGGLGLGLALVRSLVGLHGGTVEAHSDGVDRGSTFIVYLPAATPRPESRRGPPARTRVATPRRVLIVDDHVDAAALLGDALALAGHDVRTVNSPHDAVTIAREFRPDVAILDIGLPGMDGYELARTLRSTLDGAKLKLIALTGYGQPRDRELSAQAGFDAHFVKPVDLRHLHEDIARA